MSRSIPVPTPWRSRSLMTRVGGSPSKLSVTRRVRRSRSRTRRSWRLSVGRPRVGVSPEPASAASLAGAWKLFDQGVIEPGDFVVCCITGAGPKWPGVMSGRIPGEELVNPGPAILDKLMTGD